MDDVLKEKPGFYGVRLNKAGQEYLRNTAVERASKELLPHANVRDIDGFRYALATDIVLKDDQSVATNKRHYTTGMPLSKEELRRRRSKIAQVVEKLRKNTRDKEIDDYHKKFYDKLYEKHHNEILNELQAERLKFEEDNAKKADLLGIYTKPKKQLTEFSSREEELKELFGKEGPVPALATYIRDKQNDESVKQSVSPDIRRRAIANAIQEVGEKPTGITPEQQKEYLDKFYVVYKQKLLEETKSKGGRKTRKTKKSKKRKTRRRI